MENKFSKLVAFRNQKDALIHAKQASKISITMQTHAIQTHAEDNLTDFG